VGEDDLDSDEMVELSPFEPHQNWPREGHL
jgi:hypothetical protein